MRRSLAATGLALLLLPSVGTAQLFDLFYEESKQQMTSLIPSKRIVDFVIDEMLQWQEQGIRLTKDDIGAAVKGDLSTLCNGKKDAANKDLDLTLSEDDGHGCSSLRRTIMSLIRREQEAEELGTDLLTISNGSELAIADEPHRPVSMSQLSSLLRKVWSGTGMVAIPWDTNADQEFNALDAALSAESDLDGTVLRFRHGYWRDDREQDPRFASVGNGVKQKLKDLALKLDINGNPTAVGEFAVRPFTAPNVRLWARKDDLGLMWQYPSHFARLKIEEAGDYPDKPSMSGREDALAYPFSYSGSVVPPPAVVSPLCSRTVGRQGYLCRPLPATAPSCSPSSSSSSSSASSSGLAPIKLIKCADTSGVSIDSPRICPDFKRLYTDTGQPLLTDDGKTNPALQPVDTDAICSPAAAVLFEHDIPSNACYIGLCVLQSLNKHTLIPGRNSVLTVEATAPYAACVRPDPQLGMYMEVATDSPYPLPMYMGHHLVRDFDREFCLRSGDPPLGLAGLCLFRDATRARSPDVSQTSFALFLGRDDAAITGDQMQLLVAAAAIGQRAALDQTIETEQKVFAAVTNFVTQIADLLQSLSRAPLTKTPCPWTGPFRNGP
ncbi:MAG: hypothetical protein PHZ00_05780 [Candidatus Peribacteraceae bacterium]|nr:hypothetical protein [Candidatus Peribacteraceae bacterium]